MVGEMTRTMKTETRYIRLANMRLREYKEEMLISWKDDPLAFCHWLARQKSEKQWERSTWRQYKAAFIFFMKHNGPKECVDFLYGEGNAGCVKKRGDDRRGAMLKQKRLPRGDLSKILLRLSPDNKWDRLLALWLSSSVITGLRPSEWMHTSLNGTQLTVKNGKNSNGRANGEKRHLDLSPFSVTSVRALKAFMILLSKEDFKTAYNGCRARLRIISREIWPRRRLLPSLYSARHQFRADAAASGMELNEVAALMGHASDETATTHYGRKAVGEKDTSLPLPKREEVLSVRKIAKPFSPKDGQELTKL